MGTESSPGDLDSEPQEPKAVTRWWLVAGSEGGTASPRDTAAPRPPRRGPAQESDCSKMKKTKKEGGEEEGTLFQ